MKYLLDTCVISDFIKGEKNTLAHIKETSPNQLSISSITVMEIEYGLALNQARAEIIKPIIQEFIKTITVLNFGQEDAKQAALIRALLKQQGRPIGSYDVLLAGIALNRNLIFVTSNTKEFNRINELEVEDWRLSDA